MLDLIVKNGKVAYDGPAMLVWPKGVFHRVESLKEGSSAINFAIHYKGIDIKTNFNIYDLNQGTGEYILLRPGSEDHCFR